MYIAHQLRLLSSPVSQVRSTDRSHAAACGTKVEYVCCACAEHADVGGSFDLVSVSTVSWIRRLCLVLIGAVCNACDRGIGAADV